MSNQPSNKPVVFLAFANDRVEDAAYLRNLPKELGGIREALHKAVKAGLCEVVERANATIDQILDVFQDAYYKDRVAVFHYGGHANGFQLLLETMEGAHASAHSEGLVSFLVKQQGLKVIFLNGCSSQQQALDLIEAGIPAVIGTSQSINDEVATSLAIRFYSALGNGAKLERAWHEAVDQVKIQKGTANMRDLFFDGVDDMDTASTGTATVKSKNLAPNTPSGASPTRDRFPWEIYFRDGAELVKSWNLPESVDNPLFGLPEPLAQNLPEQPYRFLERYTREHCDIFFGRSYYIRDLYLTAVDKNTAPVVLFYGQSGVGKSSMLDAGVFPRLEQYCQVVYIRRDEQVGLLGTLQKALGISQEQAEKMRSTSPELIKVAEQIGQLELLLNVSPETVKPQLLEAVNQLKIHEEEIKTKAILDDRAEHAGSFADVWMHAEQRGGLPLIVLLDQVEEAFTRPNDDITDELGVFMEEVNNIFQNPRNRPEGKLILSYRKEYHPEILEACKSFGIPREEIFLKALARQDIVEVVTGLTRTIKLQRRYRLTVEDELPIIIADDLLEDKESPIAPVLQILLTKMWKQTDHEELRYFSVEKYQNLRKQGILMDDFFEEQMELLHQQFPEFVESGLALDILSYHTTKMGTANAKSLDELRERYNDRQAIVDKLLECFKTLYLLASSGTKRTGLAHDTLAPLVLSEFRKSDKPGQRAAIILENKAIAFEQNPETVIDLEDLKLVEAGASGMRLWTAQEDELVKRSQENRRKVLAFKKRIRRLGILAVLLILIGAGAAYYQSLVAAQKAKEAQESEHKALEQKALAEEQKLKADLARQVAEEEKAKAIKAEDAAVRQKEIAWAEEQKARTAEAEAIKQKDIAEKAKVKAEAATLRADSARDEAVKQQQIAEEQTRKAKREEAIANYRKKLAEAQQIAIKAQLIAEDTIGKALVALEAAETLKGLRKQAKELAIDFEPSPEGFQAMQDALSVLEDDELLDKKKYDADSWTFGILGNQLAFLNDGELVLGTLQATDGVIPQFTESSKRLRLQEPHASNYSILNLPDGNLVYGTSSGNLYIKEADELKKLYNQNGQNIVAMDYLEVAGNKWLTTASSKELLIWELDHGRERWKLPLESAVTALVWDKENRLIAADRNNTIKGYAVNDLTQGNHNPFVLTQHHAPFSCLAYEPKRNWLVAGTTTGDLLVLDLTNENKQYLFSKTHAGEVTALAFSPDGKRLASASFDGTVMVWQVDWAHTADRLSKQVPAVIQNGRKVFALDFSDDSNYVIFSDRNGLNARIIAENLLYQQLKKMTAGKKLSKEQRALYIGDDEQ
ncbi:MAG: CHAT domain-containing protein [Flammeovirgaceae bacterium]